MKKIIPNIIAVILLLGADVTCQLTPIETNTFEKKFDSLSLDITISRWTLWSPYDKADP